MAELSLDEVNDLRISLREYVDLYMKKMHTEIDSLDQKTCLRFDAVTDSIRIADKALNERLVSMNEFRSTISDQQRTFVTQAEYEAWKCRIDSEIQNLREFRAVINAKADHRSVVVGYAFTAVSILIALFGVAESLTH